MLTCICPWVIMLQPTNGGDHDVDDDGDGNSDHDDVGGLIVQVLSLNAGKSVEW